MIVVSPQPLFIAVVFLLIKIKGAAMLFSGMDEYQFATFFVVIKQEEIKKELDIERLYIDIVIKTLYKFVLKNRKYILDNFKTQYDSLWDKKFFINVVNYLRKYKNTFS